MRLSQPAHVSHGKMLRTMPGMAIRMAINAPHVCPGWRSMPPMCARDGDQFRGGGCATLAAAQPCSRLPSGCHARSAASESKIRGRQSVVRFVKAGPYQNGSVSESKLYKACTHHPRPRLHADLSPALTLNLALTLTLARTSSKASCRSSSAS